MFYEFHNTHGAPQCGCEVVRFAEWYEVEEHIEITGAYNDIENGYASIVENDEPCYLLEWDEYPFYRVVLPDELPVMHREAIAHGYGHESTFENWLSDMERSRILTYHD